MISEAVHIAKMIHQLVNTSTQPVCVHGPAFPTIFTMRALVYVSSIPPQRKALASPGLIKALLHIVEHDNTFGGHSTAAYAAMTAVNLIGREEVNEGGLTLTRQAVDKVIQQFMSYFDLSSRRASYPVVKMLVSAKILAHLIIPDTNKTFVIEHDGALDCLVLGLLLDASDPRRLEEGAVELQWTCAMILQNLALIASGVGILRTHSGTMEGLRELASTDSGAAKSEKARQCAVGAMFELEAEKRRAVLTMGSATAIEHIMLSYNWDHQAVIKRVNASLVRRGYTTWIDVEKMQGSTVEAMADAVEGAAAMCYGVSRAYKESANCRLEAQYAYQREKDMVPLMVEEGYRADGWLGMLLGTRLYYVLYGSTVSSEAAFEGKMEELCRELGDRGKGNVGSVSRIVDLALSDQAHRVSALVQCLECAARLLMVVPRKQRAALMKRVEVVQDSLEGEALAPWAGAEWAAEHSEPVSEAMTRVLSLEGSPEAEKSSTVTSVVTDLLSVLDSVSESFADRAEVLAAAVQGGGEASALAVVGVLKHGVAVMEALWTSTPRRGRKMIGTTSERAEELLESMDESGLIVQLSSCEASSLAVLCEQLCAVEALRAADKIVDAGSAVACVDALLEELGRCGDPVAHAARQLASSANTGQRLQGLNVLGALPRVVLEVGCDAEVACLGAMLGMLSKEDGGSVRERAMAAVALFTLCMRNTTIPDDFKTHSKIVCSTFRDWVEAPSAGIEGASELLAAATLCPLLCLDALSRLPRDSACSAFTSFIKLLLGSNGYARYLSIEL
jgi:hypothetical protein